MNLTMSTIHQVDASSIDREQIGHTLEWMKDNAKTIDKNTQAQFNRMRGRFDKVLEAFISELRSGNAEYSRLIELGLDPLNQLALTQKKEASSKDIQFLTENLPSYLEYLQQRIAAFKTEIAFRNFEKNLAIQCVEGHCSNFRQSIQTRYKHGCTWRLQEAKNFLLSPQCPAIDGETETPLKISKIIQSREKLLHEVVATKEEILAVQETYYQMGQIFIQCNYAKYHQNAYEQFNKKFEKYFNASKKLNNLSPIENKLFQIFQARIKTRLEEIKLLLNNYEKQSDDSPLPITLSDTQQDIQKLMSDISKFKESVVYVDFEDKEILTTGNVNYLKKLKISQLEKLEKIFEDTKKTREAREKDINASISKHEKNILDLEKYVGELQGKLKDAEQLNKVRETWEFAAPVLQDAEPPQSSSSLFQTVSNTVSNFIFGTGTPVIEAEKKES